MKRTAIPAVLALLAAAVLIATPARAAGTATVVDRFGRVLKD